MMFQSPDKQHKNNYKRTVSKKVPLDFNYRDDYVHQLYMCIAYNFSSEV